MKHVIKAALAATAMMVAQPALAHCITAKDADGKTHEQCKHKHHGKKMKHDDARHETHMDNRYDHRDGTYRDTRTAPAYGGTYMGYTIQSNQPMGDAWQDKRLVRSSH